MDLAFKKKWGIMFKALVILLVLLVPRTLIDIYGYDTVPINPVVGAFITGAIFTIAIIFTITFTDFKESEKISGELAASLKAHYNDSRVLPLADEAPARVFRAHVRDLHRTIRTCLQENTFNLPDINREMNKVNNDIRILSYFNVAPPPYCKTEKGTGCDRPDYQPGGSDHPDRFHSCRLCPCRGCNSGVILLLLFIKIDPLLEATIIFGVISSMLIGLLLLIRDMDNPFEIGAGTYADVDLETLVYLDTYFDGQDAEMERLQA